MSEARLIIGDTRDVTATLPDGSVDLIITSPPFLALRSYLPADHPDKGREIGSEATPADFLDVLLDLTTEWRRVLAPHGSLVVELGDTYSGGWVGESTPHDDRLDRSGARIQDRRGNSHQKRNKLRESNLRGWPLPKSLCGIPDLYQQSLAYGRNLLNPEHTIEPWRIRNKIAWCRPNPPVGALGDKYRPATSYLTVACVSSRRYFDLDAVRADGPNPNTHARTAKGVDSRPNDCKTSPDGNRATLAIQHEASQGAPPLDWWEIPTHPFAGAHYATWPPALLVKPILSMCPSRVCRECGKPSERITETTQVDTGRTTNGAKPRDRSESYAGTTYTTRTESAVTTLGWTDCGHNAWRNGLVFDPFAGSGTTLAVATGHGRDAIGIDIDTRNADLAFERVGMFLTVETFGQVPA